MPAKRSHRAVHAAARAASRTGRASRKLADVDAIAQASNGRTLYCGECLLRAVDMVPLDMATGRCPKCGADYRHVVARG